MNAMDPSEADTTYVIRLDMAHLRARFNVTTDEEVGDILMEYGVMSGSDPGEWVCAGRCLMAFKPSEVLSKRQP
jgi:hypothetical protein